MASLTDSTGIEKSNVLTCICCRLVFSNANEQRDHYRTDLHAFNLKRKVANLAPVSQEAFDKKMSAIATEQQAANQSITHECKICGKSYSSENQFAQHLKSRKHLDNEKNASTHSEVHKKVPNKPTTTDSTTTPTPTPNTATTTTTTNTTQTSTTTQPKQTNESQTNTTSAVAAVDEQTPQKSEEQEIEEKIQNARFFDPEECIFCDEKSKTMEENIVHMQQQHGLFIPDRDYITDLPGLITYLGEKVSVGNICLYCNGNGRSFYSLEAVRGHMRSLDHCKMDYDGNEEEYADFYDFSRDYAHIPKQENEESEGIKVKPKFTVNDAGHLVLENGSVIGNRSYAVYYKQKITNNERAVVVRNLVDKYKMLGWIGKKQGYRTETPEDMKSKNYSESKMKLRIGIATNNQKHYRNQTPF